MDKNQSSTTISSVLAATSNTIIINVFHFLCVNSRNKPSKKSPFAIPQSKKVSDHTYRVKSHSQNHSWSPAALSQWSPAHTTPMLPLRRTGHHCPRNTTNLDKLRQTQISSLPQYFQQNALIGWEFSENYRELLKQELAFLLFWVCMPSSEKRVSRWGSYTKLLEN